jgi:hypothetical protein
MAHPKSNRTHTVQNLVLPIALGAMIRPIFDSVVVGQWILGYWPPQDEHWVQDQSYELGETPLEDWLSNNINNMRSQPPRPELVRRFLMRNGTFREWDWVRVEEALKSGLPDEVKAEVQRFKLTDNSQIYVLRAEDFYREWRLLKSLGQIAGRVATSSNALLARSQTEEAERLLAEIQKHDLFPRATKAFDRSLTTSDQFDLFNSHGVPTSTKAAATSARNVVPLAQRVRQMITGVFNSAIRRALPQRPYTIWWPPSFKSGPRIRLEVHSILGVAYLALLANLSHGWKRCAREDCGHIFRVTDDKRKVFCSQYCGHLVSLRKKREAARKKKSRK